MRYRENLSLIALFSNCFYYYLEKPQYILFKVKMLSVTINNFISKFTPTAYSLYLLTFTCSLRFTSLVRLLWFGPFLL